MLEENKLKPEQIHIEITERLLMDQPEIAQETLQQCRNLGASVSIDDFGTGYSSLSYLHHFPINVLKIDRTFIINIEDKPSSQELVKSIIALGQNMGMKVIAEGIEKIEQKQILKEMGCDAAQGYFIARPLPETDFLDFLNK
jgi:EAL domain-containing protein (putative c-di-GMP-specific phosphodiesterase class I)